MAFGYCSTHQKNPQGHKGCLTCRRIALEGEIALAVVKAILDHNPKWSIDVFDCEEFTLLRSRDPIAILEAMFTTDDDSLHVRGEDDKRFGWVWFVYGNEGHDVVSDYTTNLEDVIRHVLDEYN